MKPLPPLIRILRTTAAVHRPLQAHPMVKHFQLRELSPSSTAISQPRNQPELPASLIPGDRHSRPGIWH